MPPVEILEEKAPAGRTLYRALCDEHQATAETPGGAMDALREVLARGDGDETPMLYVLQRGGPDRFFGAEQRERLDHLMQRHRAATEAGQSLPQEEQAELRELVDAELEASGNRAAALAAEIGR